MERKKFAVIGLGKFGLKLVEELAKMGLEIIAIDKNPNKIEKVREIVSEGVILDATDKNSLEETGVKEVDCVVVSLGKQTETSILITALLKEIGVEQIVCRANSYLHATILKKIGAKRDAFQEENTAVRLAHTIHFSNVQEYIAMQGPRDLVELGITYESKLRGKSIREIKNWLKDKVDILAVEKEKVVKEKIEEGEKEELVNLGLKEEKEKRESIIPTGDYVIGENDILILFGEPKDLENFIGREEI